MCCCFKTAPFSIRLPEQLDYLHLLLQLSFLPPLIEMNVKRSYNLANYTTKEKKNLSVNDFHSFK